MEQAKSVAIVARTRMHDGRVCIGALSDHGENMRLMNSACGSDSEQHSPYHVGEKWLISCSPCGERKPPHVEDVAVSEAAKLGTVSDIVGHVLRLAKPWMGGIGVLFEGKIRFTRNGAGYVSRTDVPSCSTGFWIPYCDLSLGRDDRDEHSYYALGDYRHLSYVGVQTPIDLINAKQLVRVSLARWWRPADVEPTFEERCYAQLSGWY